MHVKSLLYRAEENTSMQERIDPVPQFNRGQERVGRLDTKPNDVEDGSWYLHRIRILLSASE